jgi:leucyl aminopeptidase (aminopeptidase T)
MEKEFLNTAMVYGNGNGAFQRDFRSIPFDAELTPGAFNAINTCLKLQPGERITIVCGEECLEIAAALVQEIEKVGSKYAVFVLEDFCQRPCLNMPHDILADLKTSQVSIYAAHAKPGELPARIQLTRMVTAHHIRHGHMVNISNEIMLQGMRADFNAVDELSTRVFEKARQAKVIRAKSRGGTDIEVHFSPLLHWLKTSGIITPQKWNNLPGGEVLTSPARIDGYFVTDGVVGDYLCDRYGDLKDTPLCIEIEDSRIKTVECDNQQLLADFLKYTSTDENSNRVGEFAIGTNIAVNNVIGNILQDEKIPGVHIAFGDSYWEHTGQHWSSSTHIDCVGRDFNIWMDDDKIMEDGKFLI